MEGGQAGSGGSTSGGPAPFLLKTYDMVDDSSTDEIVSWSSKKNSFVVWNPPEFARLLLPTYFKHNNFSSFIRQLNTYGFRKIDPERWEFANDDFAKDQKHLLKNIHRRKPIHSHSQPQGSSGDSERAALEEEIGRLSQEKDALHNTLCTFKQQQSVTKVQLEDLERRVHEMGQRQLRMMNFLAKAVQNPTFVENLIQMVGSCMDIEAITKKRRIPIADYSHEILDDSLMDDHSSNSKSEFGHIFHQDFSNKLKLELSPAVSDSNLVSQSTQSSNEDGRSPQRKTSECDMRDGRIRTEVLSFSPERLELSDTGTSFALKKDAPMLGQVRENESSRFHSVQHGITSTEEGDGHISCHLNLTLASSALQESGSNCSARVSQLDQDANASSALRSIVNGKETDAKVVSKDRDYSNDDVTASSQEAPVNSQGPAVPQGRVNDLFWEQFLTERPGSSDNEEASSCFRANSFDDQEDRKPGYAKSWRNRKDMEQLTL
ncbi:PREDICTED: heat stress transcription factor A-5 [Nelumbo nucifera]|uniref:Heat stress transcription factor A-5 n=1 Tax=Nelumbo nucifera TaxID=4432 RepID=A0A1U7Z337_NELNU|nr:PREDICTED: heat stress transcription factor A-5 [Nelumbo nucifera]